MSDLKIYIDRLQNENSIQIEETVTSRFLELNDSELTFSEEITLEAEAYLADDHLVIHLSIDAEAHLPCSICNQPVNLPIQIKNTCITEALADIEGPLYDLGKEIRETILLQTPLFAECAQGNCPEREFIKNFTKQSPTPFQTAPVNHFPFADL